MSKNKVSLRVVEESKTGWPKPLLSQLEQNEVQLCEYTVHCLLDALRAKDHYTFHHSLRVANYSLILAEGLDLTAEQKYDLKLAALLHDIGKIGIPESILKKPHRLSEDEFLIMKNHPIYSAEILKSHPYLTHIAHYALHHHERFDGRGYPDGLAGLDIPEASRIILIADTFDAMTSSRPYRKGLDDELAFSELVKFSGKQCDPNLVEIFIQEISKTSEISDLSRLNLTMPSLKKVA